MVNCAANRKNRVCPATGPGYIAASEVPGDFTSKALPPVEMTHMHIVHKLLQAFEVVRTRNTGGGIGASRVRANAFAAAAKT